MKKFVLPIDGEMGFIQKKYKFKVYWIVPFLTKQGSIEGIYHSNIRKGSITEKINRILRKTEKISPSISKIMIKVFDKAQKIKFRYLSN